MGGHASIVFKDEENHLIYRGSEVTEVQRFFA